MESVVVPKGGKPIRRTQIVLTMRTQVRTKLWRTKLCIPETCITVNKPMFIAIHQTGIPDFLHYWCFARARYEEAQICSRRKQKSENRRRITVEMNQ
jgi:hypothetical protein